MVMDTSTGAVLVSVSSPGYNPNLFVDGIDRNIYAGLLRSKDTPLLNRTLQGKYPPGSTIKPMLALGGLSHHVRAPETETWCPGWYSLRGSTRRYRDWKKEGHGHMDMVHAISQSCDVYFYVLARDMNIDLIHQTLTEFGLGKRTGIDIGGEGAGLVPSTQWKRTALGEPWYPGETLIAGIGQGATLVTPIQLAVATAVIANRGKLVRPYLLSEVRDSATGQQVIRATTHEGRRVVAANPQDWDVIIHSMQEVVHGERGTARSSGAGTDYQFAGKTGTAQVITIGQDEEYDEDEIPEELRDHALFIAFAPVEAPEIALAVIVENGGGGSTTAAPLARELLDHYFNRQKDSRRDERGQLRTKTPCRCPPVIRDRSVEPDRIRSPVQRQRPEYGFAYAPLNPPGGSPVRDVCRSPGPPARLSGVSLWFYLVSLGLLILVLFFGETGKGAQRWLGVGPFRFQPSELMKLALPMVIALYLSKELPPPSMRKVFMV